jgi:hypothetical protein
MSSLVAKVDTLSFHSRFLAEDTIADDEEEEGEEAMDDLLGLEEGRAAGSVEEGFSLIFESAKNFLFLFALISPIRH